MQDIQVLINDVWDLFCQQKVSEKELAFLLEASKLSDAFIFPNLEHYLFAGSKLNGMIAEIMINTFQQIQDEQSIQNHWSNLSYLMKILKNCNFDREESLLCKLVTNCLSTDQLRK